MVDRWHYAHEGERFGPFSAQQLKDLAARGNILPSDTVWKEGVTQGAAARKVKYLFAPAQVEAFPVSHRPLQTQSASSPTCSHPSSDAPAVEMLSGRSPNLPNALGVIDDANTRMEVKVPTAGENGRRVTVELAKPARQGRAVAVKGAVIVAQDGVNFKYRKKCSACGYEDSCWHTATIKTGTTRVHFFCPKCRRKRDGEIQCYST